MKIEKSAVIASATNLSASEEAAFTARDLLLYAITVFSWSASWYALTSYIQGEGREADMLLVLIPAT